MLLALTGNRLVGSFLATTLLWTAMGSETAVGAAGLFSKLRRASDAVVIRERRGVMELDFNKWKKVFRLISRVRRQEGKHQERGKKMIPRGARNPVNGLKKMELRNSSGNQWR